MYFPFIVLSVPGHANIFIISVEPNHRLRCQPWISFTDRQWRDRRYVKWSLRIDLEFCNLKRSVRVFAKPDQVQKSGGSKVNAIVNMQRTKVLRREHQPYSITFRVQVFSLWPKPGEECVVKRRTRMNCEIRSFPWCKNISETQSLVISDIFQA